MTEAFTPCQYPNRRLFLSSLYMYLQEYVGDPDWGGKHGDVEEPRLEYKTSNISWLNLSYVQTKMSWILHSNLSITNNLDVSIQFYKIKVIFQGLKIELMVLRFPYFLTHCCCLLYFIYISPLSIMFMLWWLSNAVEYSCLVVGQ